MKTTVGVAFGVELKRNRTERNGTKVAVHVGFLQCGVCDIGKDLVALRSASYEELGQRKGGRRRDVYVDV